MQNYNPKFVFLASFARRLQARDPSALATLRGLVNMHHQQNPAATRSLKALAGIMRRPDVIAAGAHHHHRHHHHAAGFEAIGALGPHAIPHAISSVFATASKLLEGTGKVAAKPFRFVQTKLDTKFPRTVAH